MTSIIRSFSIVQEFKAVLLMELCLSSTLGPVASLTDGTNSFLSFFLQHIISVSPRIVIILNHSASTKNFIIE